MIPDFQVEVGKRIKNIRVKNNVTKRYLSLKKFGKLVDQEDITIIKKWESGLVVPTVRQLKIIENLGRTTFDELLQRNEDSASSIIFNDPNGIFDKELMLELEKRGYKIRVLELSKPDSLSKNNTSSIKKEVKLIE